MTIVGLVMRGAVARITPTTAPSINPVTLVLRTASVNIAMASPTVAGIPKGLLLRQQRAIMRSGVGYGGTRFIRTPNSRIVLLYSPSSAPVFTRPTFGQVWPRGIKLGHTRQTLAGEVFPRDEA